MKKEDIVFVINPARWNNDMFSIGILNLSAFLQQNGLENIILDSAIAPGDNHESGEKLIIDRIRELKPKIVCFTSTHYEFDAVIRMNGAIKNMDADIYTIVGGPQPTFRPLDFLEFGFDFVAVGEGEFTLLEFVREIIDGSYQWEKIAGLLWKAHNGKNTRNPPRKLMSSDDLNETPILPYEKIDPKHFDCNDRLIRGLPLKGAMIMTSRGCPFSCSFCGCGLIFGKKIRYYSLDHIEREIKHLKTNFHIEGLWIADDTFTVKIEHVKNVGQILKKYDIIWGCQSRVDIMNQRLVNTMKDLGCVQLDMGAESGSQRILDNIIGKGTNIKQIKHAFKMAKKYELRTLANFMIGLPTETYKDLRKTKRLAKKIKADYYVFSIATPLPGTRLYKIVNEDIKAQDFSLLDWNGSDLLEKINKSEIKNLSQTVKELRTKFNRKTNLGRLILFKVVSVIKSPKKIFRFISRIIKKNVGLSKIQAGKE